VTHFYNAKSRLNVMRDPDGGLRCAPIAGRDRDFSLIHLSSRIENALVHLGSAPE
jgi:hypothetical protein